MLPTHEPMTCGHRFSKLADSFASFSPAHYCSIHIPTPGLEEAAALCTALFSLRGCGFLAKQARMMKRNEKKKKKKKKNAEAQ
jgi:hypothetical protein